MIFAINPPLSERPQEGFPNRRIPFLRPLTPNGVNRVRKGSFQRISSDQFRPLQIGSMDVSEDRAQYRTHLQDLLTSSASSLVGTSE